MTFHDPASIESGCVYTRGRNHESHKREMYSKIIFWVTLLGLQTLCFGVPDDNNNVTTISPNNTTLSISNDKEEQTEVDTSSIDNSTSTSPVIFLDVPKHTGATLGKSVLLKCRTTEPVIECQWSWRSLPPVHPPHPDINPSQDGNETAPIIATVPPTATTQSLPVVMSLFSAFGNDNNDCSVRFTDTQHEQSGYWTCAVRKSINDPFVSTEPAMLSIVNEKSETSLQFIDTENATEALVGSSAELICRTKTPVKKCQWSWRLFNQTESRDLEVNKFSALGTNNTDCSIKFKNVLAEQEGLWTCGVQYEVNETFVKANPIRFFVSEVEFVQLSSGIQIAAGESALLRCLVDKPVAQCEWSWKPINSTKEPTVIKAFKPKSDSEHDCSVKFKNVLYEEEGLWTCGVRLIPHGHLHEAPPAKLTLLPSGKIDFAEIPENKSVLVNTQETLKCLAYGKVDKCAWLWRPLTGDSEATVVREFPGTGNLGKNCSLDFTHVNIEDQGYWACRVIVTSSNTELTSPFVKLIVYDQDNSVKFSELSQNISISSGGSVSLRCVTSSSVEQCRWSLTPVNSNTTVVIRQFSALGPEGRDCSVRLTNVLGEQEGLYTCGAKIHGKENYTNAPPAKLSLLEPVAVTLWTNSHQKVTLACKLNPIPEDAKCQWIHKSSESDERNNTLRRSRQELNYTTGICTLQFTPILKDLGSWFCQFSIERNNGIIMLGNASMILMKTQAEDEWLSWAVGAATTLVLFLMILIVVLVVYRGRLFDKAELRMLETISFEPQERAVHQNARNQQNKATKPNSRLPEAMVGSVNPNFYDCSQQYHPPMSKIYESFTTS